MKVIQIDSTDRQNVNAFINLPYRLYAGNPCWVPPLVMEMRGVLDPGRHPFYQHGAAAFYLALDAADKPIGRLAVMENQAYNDYNREKTAFFTYFECEDNPTTAAGLFESGFTWAHNRGLKNIHGPKGFTALDGMGLLVKGFEHHAALSQAYNPPYYDRLLLGLGFETDRELVSGYLSRNLDFPEKIKRASELVNKRYGIYARRFHSKRELLRLLPSLLKLYNDSLVSGEGNYPITASDMKTMSDQLFLFADPRLVKILMKEDQPIGFLLTYPDISAAIQRCRGRLLPFGWLGILLEPRRTDWLNVNGAAILEQYQGMGGTAVLFNELFRSVQESRYRQAEVIQIDVKNVRMQNEMLNFGVDFYKMHRTYQRDI
jgi:hypothetical protein